MDMGGNDTIFPQLAVHHSYDGSVKYKIIFGFYRTICSNGLVVPVKELEKFNLCIEGKHTENINKSFLLLKQSLDFILADNLKDVIAPYMLMGGKVVDNVEDRIKEVLNAANITAVDNKNRSTVDYIKSVIDTEVNHPDLNYNGVVNDWLVYNAINHYINNDDLNVKSQDTRLKSEQSVLSFMLA
jgi:hypothetical protein